MKWSSRRVGLVEEGAGGEGHPEFSCAFPHLLLVSVCSSFERSTYVLTVQISAEDPRFCKKIGARHNCPHTTFCLYTDKYADRRSALFV
jgi:hypothetical protein